MKTQLKSWILIFILFVSAQAFARAKSKARYPMVQYIEGQASNVEPVVTIVKREPQISEKKKALKRNFVFKDKALIQTAEKSEVRLALSAHATLVIQENSTVQIPAIAWKDGSVSDIHVKQGAVRYLCQQEKSENCQRTLKTPLYEIAPPAGDYVLRYAPAVPEVEMTVLSGEVPFGGVENEKIVTLKAGDKASFKGVIENNEVAFDILLKGRKVAKGEMGEIQKVPASELETFAKKEAIHQKKVKTPPKSKRTAAQICDKPWGELNQCAWVCENNKKKSKKCELEKGAQCVRTRCNANGEWADRQELPASQSKCELKPVVAACDY